jgi:hypothetical protein
MAGQYASAGCQNTLASFGPVVLSLPTRRLFGAAGRAFNLFNRIQTKEIIEWFAVFCAWE